MQQRLFRHAGLIALLAVFIGCSDESVETASESAEPRLHFREQVLEPELGIGYGVLVADINADGRPDIVASSEDKVMWFENPTWEKHVISDGAATPHHVCLAVHDIDGDGKLDIALGADWQARNTEGAGTLQWLRQGDDPAGEWSLHAISSEPTLHRIRWGDIDGDGNRELLVAPLHGRGTKSPSWWEGAGARLLAFRPPDDPASDRWPSEVVDDTFHVMHNFLVTNFDDDPAEELITASHEGVYLLDRAEDGVWSRRRLGEGHQLGDADKGAGEVKLGKLANGRRYIATVEPWHANHIVIYEEGETPDALWQRRILTDKLGGGHALWCGDLDGDGDEELIFGWRQEGSGEFEKPGVGVFDPGDWSYRIIDSGGMATEDLTVADLDGDGKPEIIAAGRATHNLKIYWNERD